MNALPSHLSPEPTDSEDVVSALETADVFWTKGDATEAMRWLKRAAESASDAGNDDRALAIARTVADLKAAPRAVEAPLATHKLNPPPPPSAARQAPSPPSAARLATAESSEVRRAPVHSPPPTALAGEALVPVKDSAAQKAPPPTPKPRESISPATAAHRPSSMPPPLPKRSSATERTAVDVQEPTRAVAAPPTKQQAPAAAATAPEPVRPASAATQPLRTQPVAVSPAATAEAPVLAARRPPSAASATKEPNRAPAAATAATAYRALTVFVRPEGRNGDKLEVILAMPGQAVPAGAEPAMLVPTRRGARLLGE